MEAMMYVYQAIGYQKKQQQKGYGQEEVTWHKGRNNALILSNPT
jgi:hypothetical protein